MSLAIVASVCPKGITVVDSQTVLVRIPCGGLITLNFVSPEEMMVAAEAMAFTAAVASNPLVVLVPETPTNNNSTEEEEVIVVDGTPPAPPKEASNSNNDSDNLDSSEGSRDLLASSLDEDEDERGDRFDEDLAEGVRRVKFDCDEEDSFEDTIGLTQEFF
jgi:hypothetical protein